MAKSIFSLKSSWAVLILLWLLVVLLMLLFDWQRHPIILGLWFMARPKWKNEHEEIHFNIQITDFQIIQILFANFSLYSMFLLLRHVPKSKPTSWLPIQSSLSTPIITQSWLLANMDIYAIQAFIHHMALATVAI